VVRFSLALLVALTTSVFGAGVATALPDTRCGGANGWSVGVVGAASCGIALNVARAIDTDSRFNGIFSLQVFSPVTGQSYEIKGFDATPLSKQSLAYECGVISERGGLVYLWR
jgi:hypothetical protein